MWRLTLLCAALALSSPAWAGVKSGRMRDYETENVDEADDLFLAKVLSADLRELLDDQKNELDQRLDGLTQLVMETCRRDVSAEAESSAFESELKEVVTGVRGKLLTLGEEIVQGIEEKLTAISAKILSNIELQMQVLAKQQDLAELKTQTSTLATSAALSDLQRNLSDIASTSAEEVKQTMSHLATKHDVKVNKVDILELLEQIKQQLDNTSTCNQNQDFERVLQMMSNTETDIDVLADTITSSLTELKETCRSEPQSGGGDTLTTNLRELIGQLQVVIENTNRADYPTHTIDEEPSGFSVSIGASHDFPHHVFDTQFPSQPDWWTTTTTTVPPPTQPAECRDSNFSINFNLCEAVVRNNKCNVQFVAKHCCKSCSEALNSSQRSILH